MKKLKGMFNSLFIIGVVGLSGMYLLVPNSEIKNYFVFQIILFTAIIPRVFLEVFMLFGNINYSKTPYWWIATRLLLFYSVYCAAFECIFSPSVTAWFIAILIPIFVIFGGFLYYLVTTEEKNHE